MSSPYRVFWPLAVLAASLAFGACGSSSPDPGQNPDPSFVNCEGETRADSYAPGMTKAGTKGQISIKLIESAPAPPIRGDNSWVVEVTDLQGMPLDGLALTVTPFMPDHQHGTSVKAVITPEGTPGRYQLTPLNLFMAGLWQVTLVAKNAGGVNDQAMFAFCVPS